MGQRVKGGIKGRRIEQLHGLQPLTTEVATLRDDVNVMAAIVRRIDNNQDRMLDELRAMHRQHERVADRVRQLEEKRVFRG
jgi:hypothetical protein